MELSEELWLIANQALLAKRIRACQLWRTAPNLTPEECEAINAKVRRRLELFGTDLEKEYAVPEKHQQRPRAGDWVEFTPTLVGVIQYIVYDSGPSSAAVKVRNEIRFVEWEELADYTSKGGRTRWIIS